MKKLFEEFKQFALKGNMFDMAIGIIIGGAFTSVVTALTDNLIRPLLDLFTGTVHSLSEVGGFAMNFLSAFINFLITAVILFFLMKLINKLMTIGKKKQAEEEAEAAPPTKKCPYCMSDIDINATRCPHCTSVIEETEEKAE